MAAAGGGDGALAGKVRALIAAMSGVQGCEMCNRTLGMFYSVPGSSLGSGLIIIKLVVQI